MAVLLAAIAVFVVVTLCCAGEGRAVKAALRGHSTWWSLVVAGGALAAPLPLPGSQLLGPIDISHRAAHQHCVPASRRRVPDPSGFQRPGARAQPVLRRRHHDLRRRYRAWSSPWPGSVSAAVGQRPSASLGRARDGGIALPAARLGLREQTSLATPPARGRGGHGHGNRSAGRNRDRRPRPVARESPAPGGARMGVRCSPTPVLAFYG